MKPKKLPILIIGFLFLLLIALTGIRGLAQEASGDIYLPLIFWPNGEPAPTKTATATASATVTASATTSATATPTSTGTSTPTPTSTGSTTATPTSTTTTDCALLDMADFEIRQYNRPAVRIINNSANPITITQFGLEWVSAETWGYVLGYPDIHIDWFKWQGTRFYEGDDYDEPTFVNAAITLGPNSEGEWEIDFDWIGETDWAFIDEFGLTQENFGFFVQFDNGCTLHRPEVVSLAPTLTPSPTPTGTQDLTPTVTGLPLDCDDYTMSDFEIDQYNRPVVQINNNSGGDVYISEFQLYWQSAYAWAHALGYSDIRVDWFSWNGNRFYHGEDYDSPTFSSENQFLPAYGSGQWVADLDWSGETEWGLVNEFGLTPDNFGFWVFIDNSWCVLGRPETPSFPSETPTITPTTALDRGLPDEVIKSAKKGDL